MTPEELLRSLKSNDEWTVNTLAPRANPFADAVDIRTPSRVRVIVLEFAAVAAAIALVAAVVGAQTAWRNQLAGPNPAPVITGSPETTSPPSPDPAPTPPVVNTKPALSDLRLSAEGLGSLRVGESISSQNGPNSLVEFDPELCGPPGSPSGGPGWVSRYENGPFSVFVDDPADPNATLISVAVRSGEIQTTEGIRVGATVDKFLAAYGDSAGQPQDVGQLRFYAVQGENNTLNFAFEHADETAEGTPIVGPLYGILAYRGHADEIPALQQQCRQ